MKLKNKIFWYSTFLFIIIIVLLSATIYFTFTKITYDREMERIEADAENILKGLQLNTDQFTNRDLLSVYVPNSGMLKVVNLEGEFITASLAGDTPTSLKDEEIEFTRGRQSKIIEHRGLKYGFFQLPTVWGNGQVVYLQVFESLELLEDNLTMLRVVIILVTLIAIIPIIVSGKLLSDLIIHPIQSLIKTMNEIKRSHSFKHIQLNKQSNDELFTMGQTFNELMDLLKENYEKQESFVSNASHELRTPLTVIESYANLVKRRGFEQPELVKESIEAIHSEAVRMRDLTEQLLLLARRDKDWVLDIKPVDLNELIKDVTHHMTRAFRRKIEVDATSYIVIKTDEQKLKQLIYIFLDNARKYSDDVINVQLEKVNDRPVLKIIDRGMGIPKSAQGMVFDRFYRVDEARNRDQGGTGLGLSVAKEISEALNIDIRLESEENVGTTIILTFNSSTSH